MSYVCTLPPEVQQHAKDHLNEDESRRDSDLEALREWLKKQKHLHSRTDDKFLLTFLRGCKFSLERTKEKLDMNLTVKSAIPEFFDNWDPLDPEMQELLDLGTMLPLPGYDDQGRRVILQRGTVCDPAKHDFLKFQKATFMITSVMVEEDEQSAICGFVFISDSAGANMAHLTAITPSIMKKMMKCYEDASPIRPKQIHHINMASFVVSFVNTLMPLMKEKMRQRTRFHRDYDSLYKDVPKRLLPKEYGGDGMSVAELTEYWKRKVVENRKFLMEQTKYKSDESKRPGKPRNSEYLFGIAGTEGSFRQLSID